MKFGIEKATLKDTKTLSKLECRCYGYPWHPYANWFWKHAAEYVYAYKATDGGRIVGGIVALPTRQRTVYVDTCFVAEGHRGRGIGEALMRRVLRDARGRKVQLDTMTYNKAAKNLFAKLGFKKKSILRNYYDENIDYVFFERF